MTTESERINHDQAWLTAATVTTDARGPLQFTSY
jgi:hypothetical protein